ncbi:MAG: T9SS type A sorting domain-containing protein [Flavobacteriales bacterium]|nr:T9SS type A sorting domain-containing protein [Flavobacteriales bacterium]
MNRTLTPILFLAATGAFAQPTIPQVVLNVGDQLVIDPTFPISDAGPGGANATWNFAAPGFSGGEFTYTAVSAASTTMASDFPGATMALYAEMDADFTLHAFFDLNGGFTEHGEHVFDGNTGVSSINTDPITFFTTPLTATSNGSDTYGSTEDFVGFPALLTGQHTWSVDGYGTLILPNATYTDVLRIHAQQVETLSVDIGVPFEMVSSREEWRWVKSGIPFPLLVFSLETDEFGTEIGATAALVSYSSATSIAEQAQLPMRTYPNPMHDVVTMELEASGTVHYRVLDALGREVLSGSTAGGGLLRHAVDISTLSSGIHLLEVRSQQGVATARLIKE